MAYQNSYLSRTINDWNILPTDTIEIADTHLFMTRLQSYYVHLMYCVYVIPEHTSRADCSVNNNNNNTTQYHIQCVVLIGTIVTS